MYAQLTTRLLSVCLTAALLADTCGTSQKQSQEKVFQATRTGDIDHLDPAVVSSAYACEEIFNVYEGLLQYHYLRQKPEIIPCLAQELPVVSQDGRTYTFKIKRGVLFHDNPCFPEGKGRELTAHDFVYSLMRVADPKVPSPWVDPLLDCVEGLKEWRVAAQTKSEATNYDLPIAGLRAIDRYTFEIKLNKPCPHLLYYLAMPFSVAVPREAVEHYNEAFGNHPVGTGPFVSEEYKSRMKKIVYHKNKKYRKELFPTDGDPVYQHMIDAYGGKPLPLIDKIVTTIITEEQPRWLSFQKGSLDTFDLRGSNNLPQLLHMGDGKGESDLTLQPEYVQKGMKLHLSPGISTSCYIFNNAHKLFKDNVRLRQAISMAFDVQESVKRFSMPGVHVLAQSIIPPALAGYEKDFVNPYRTYNLEKAKRLLAEAGYPNGKGLPKITLDIPPGTSARQKAEFFKSCMAKVGIEIELVSSIFPEMCRRVRQGMTMIHGMAWNADYPDAENFLVLFYRNKGDGLGTFFNNQAYNVLYEKAVRMTASPERTACYRDMNRLIGVMTPVICTDHVRMVHMRHEWLKNYVLTDLTCSTAKYLDIDLAQKSKRIASL